MAGNMKWHAKWQCTPGNYTGKRDSIDRRGTANGAGNGNETKHDSGNGDGNGEQQCFCTGDDIVNRRGIDNNI